MLVLFLLFIFVPTSVSYTDIVILSPLIKHIQSNSSKFLTYTFFRESQRYQNVSEKFWNTTGAVKVCNIPFVCKLK